MRRRFSAVLVNTLLFLSAKLFVLRGGHELRSLSSDQIQFEEKQDGYMCVTYKEKVSKTNQGGLKRRKVEQKVVQHLEDRLMRNHLLSYTIST